mgnify:CR=1 FL=1
MNNLIIIPSLNPDNKLIKVIKELKENNINNIIVIDDGSKDLTVFNKLDVPVVHHEVNKGKGAAIKTALKEYQNYYKDIKGFITVDDDGQHSTKDIVNINNKLKDNVIFGVRNFKGKDVPNRSKFGNKFSSIYFYLTKGVKLTDTQTGLRAFPIKYKELLLSVEGDRFEYEMNVLNRLADEKITIDTVSIETIYENNNSGSRFKGIKDSLRIYKNFFITLTIVILLIVFVILCMKVF